MTWPSSAWTSALSPKAHRIEGEPRHMTRWSLSISTTNGFKAGIRANTWGGKAPAHSAVPDAPRCRVSAGHGRAEKRQRIPPFPTRPDAASPPDTDERR
jgi:hypothetical protein